MFLLQGAHESLRDVNVGRRNKWYGQFYCRSRNTLDARCCRRVTKSSDALSLLLKQVQLFLSRKLLLLKCENNINNNFLWGSKKRTHLTSKDPDTYDKNTNIVKIKHQYCKARITDRLGFLEVMYYEWTLKLIAQGYISDLNRLS